jgi:hypothetical protein
VHSATKRQIKSQLKSEKKSQNQNQPLIVKYLSFAEFALRGAGLKELGANV